MKLIADSGSTKTHWCMIESENTVKEFYTKGINPFYQTKEEILAELKENLYPRIMQNSIDSIHFYGAGFAFAEQKKMLSEIFKIIFGKELIVTVESDLLGAARSLFGKGNGIACILGTGSNSCYYNGKGIEKNVPPLGFILGDEGSGAILGKKLMSDALKNQLPPDLISIFMKEYDLTLEKVLDHVYKKPFPNRYLAQFVPFIKENIQYPPIYNIVYGSFNEFFTRNICQYPHSEETALGFIGSVAYHFADILQTIARERHFKIVDIAQHPMKGLVKFHAEKSKN
jgi:N-acetylglucosamine kinase-like BadF-type ATPase